MVGVILSIPPIMYLWMLHSSTFFVHYAGCNSQYFFYSVYMDAITLHSSTYLVNCAGCNSQYLSYSVLMDDI